MVGGLLGGALLVGCMIRCGSNVSRTWTLHWVAVFCNLSFAERHDVFSSPLVHGVWKSTPYVSLDSKTITSFSFHTLFCSLPTLHTTIVFYKFERGSHSE